MPTTSDYLRQCGIDFLQFEAQWREALSVSVFTEDVLLAMMQTEEAESYEDGCNIWMTLVRNRPAIPAPVRRELAFLRHDWLFRKASAREWPALLTHIVELLLLTGEDWRDLEFPEKLINGRRLRSCLFHLCNQIHVACPTQSHGDLTIALSALLSRPERSCVKEHPTLSLPRSTPQLLLVDWAKTHWTFLNKGGILSSERITELVPNLLACHCLAASASNVWDDAMAENANEVSARLLVGYLVVEAKRFRWLHGFLQEAVQKGSCDASSIKLDSAAWVESLRQRLRVAEGSICDLWRSAQPADEQLEQRSLETLLGCLSFLAGLEVLTEDEIGSTGCCGRLPRTAQENLRRSFVGMRRIEWQESLEKRWKRVGKKWGPWEGRKGK